MTVLWGVPCVVIHHTKSLNSNKPKTASPEPRIQRVHACDKPARCNFNSCGVVLKVPNKDDATRQSRLLCAGGWKITRIRSERCVPNREHTHTHKDTNTLCVVSAHGYLNIVRVRFTLQRIVLMILHTHKHRPINDALTHTHVHACMQHSWFLVVMRAHTHSRQQGTHASENDGYLMLSIETKIVFTQTNTQRHCASSSRHSRGMFNVVLHSYMRLVFPRRDAPWFLQHQSFVELTYVGEYAQSTTLAETTEPFGMMRVRECTFVHDCALITHVCVHHACIIAKVYAIQCGRNRSFVLSRSTRTWSAASCVNKYDSHHSACVYVCGVYAIVFAQIIFRTWLMKYILFIGSKRKVKVLNWSLDKIIIQLKFRKDHNSSMHKTTEGNNFFNATSFLIICTIF